MKSFYILGIDKISGIAELDVDFYDYNPSGYKCKITDILYDKFNNFKSNHIFRAEYYEIVSEQTVIKKLFIDGMYE